MGSRPSLRSQSYITGFAFPCLEVNTADGEDRGYVVLRRPGTLDIVLAPTKRVVGVEDAWLRNTEAPNYFRDAWNARSFLNELGPRPLGNQGVALAPRSPSTRYFCVRKINSISTSDVSPPS